MTGWGKGAVVKQICWSAADDKEPPLSLLDEKGTFQNTEARQGLGWDLTNS
jgi:hypothetical protein